MLSKINVLFLSAVFVFTFALAGSVYAYEYYEGWDYWDNYEFVDGISSGQYYNAANIYPYTYPHDYGQAYESAMEDWNSNTEANINATGGDTKIEMYVGDYGEMGVYGWCEWYLNGNQVGGADTGATENWDEAETYLNIHDIKDDDPLSDSEVEAVATHELGHALGLAHENEEQSVMDDDEYLSQQWYGVQPDDIAGVNALY